MMYHIWIIVEGRKYAVMRPRAYAEALSVAQTACELDRVQRAEVTRMDNGECVFTCETVNGY